MDLELKGKRALVAASTVGIGKAIAEAFAREGMVVCVNGRRAAPLEATRSEIAEKIGATVVGVPADVSTASGAAQLIERGVAEMGGLDVLVTNAGGPIAGGFFDLTDDDWESAFQTNLMSTVRMIRAAVPHLRKSSQGRIINLQSVGAKQPVPYVTLTNCIRAGVFGLNKELADVLGKDNITVNTILSGPVPTERLDYLLTYRAEKLGLPLEEVKKRALEAVPLGRFGTGDDIAAIFVFLASRPAGWISGTVTQVDGGRTRAAL